MYESFEYLDDMGSFRDWSIVAASVWSPFLKTGVTYCVIRGPGMSTELKEVFQSKNRRYESWLLSTLAGMPGVSLSINSTTFIHVPQNKQ